MSVGICKLSVEVVDALEVALDLLFLSHLLYDILGLDSQVEDLFDYVRC